MRRNCAVVVFTKLKGRLLHLTRLRSLEYSWVSRNLNYSPCPLFKNRKEFCVLLVFQCCLSSHMSSGVVWWKQHWPDLFKHDHNALLLWNDSVLALLACSQVGSAGKLGCHLVSCPAAWASAELVCWTTGWCVIGRRIISTVQPSATLNDTLSPGLCPLSQLLGGGGLQDLASDTFP